MTSRTPSEPPDEPLNVAEPQLLSPASPKPIHFPTPTNIPVLEMQMDVGFNQTEAHMNDPAMRNTEVRPNLWRDPNEDDSASKPTHNDTPQLRDESASAVSIKQEPDTAETIAHNVQPADPSTLSNGSISHLLNHDPTVALALPNVQPTIEQTASFDSANSHPDIHLAQPPPTAFNGAVDVQALLTTLGQGVPHG